METIYKWITELDALDWIIAGSVLVIFVSTGIYFDLGKQDWAYWVQAICAIAAIFAVVGVAVHQYSSAERIRRIAAAKADLEYGDLCLSIAIETWNCLADTRQKFQDRMHSGTYAIGRERYDQLLAALQTVMAKPVPPMHVKELLVLQREVAFTQTAIRELGTNPASTDRIDKAMKRELRAKRCVSVMRAYRIISFKHFEAIG